MALARSVQTWGEEQHERQRGKSVDPTTEHVPRSQSHQPRDEEKKPEQPPHCTHLRWVLRDLRRSPLALVPDPRYRSSTGLAYPLDIASLLEHPSGT